MPHGLATASEHRSSASKAMRRVPVKTIPKRLCCEGPETIAVAELRIRMTIGASHLEQGHGSDLAFTDALTGLGNHRRFHDKVERLISDRADDPAPFAVGILDLDGFKPINDLFGHKAGDDILIQVAMRLRAAMDGYSTVCPHRRRRIRLSLSDGVQRGGGGRQGSHADRDPVRALRCRRAHRAPVGLGRLLAVLFRRRHAPKS